MDGGWGLVCTHPGSRITGVGVRILRGMGVFLLIVLTVCLVIAWCVHMNSKAGKLPTREVKPQPLGRGFRASSESDLTRLADSGYRVRSDEDA